jgi:uncharacterized membrane protein YccF (DUF307 family)
MEVSMVRAISYILLVFLSILLVITIPIGITAFSANSTFLKPYSSDAYLVKSGINSELKLIVKESLVGSDSAKNTSPLAKLRNKLVGQAFDSIVTDDLVSQKMNLLQISLWDYFTGKSKKLLTIPIPELSVALQAANVNLGDKTDLFSLLGGKTDELENIKTTYQLYQKGTFVIYILIPILLIVCVLLALSLDRSLWIGSCLVIGGLLTLLLWVPVTLFTNSINVPIQMQKVSERITSLIMLARHDFLIRLSIVSAAVLLIGVIAMLIMKRRNTA